MFHLQADITEHLASMMLRYLLLTPLAVQRHSLYPTCRLLADALIPIAYSLSFTLTTNRKPLLHNASDLSNEIRCSTAISMLVGALAGANRAKLM